jgi:hypothetical protein
MLTLVVGVGRSKEEGEGRKQEAESRKQGTAGDR